MGTPTQDVEVAIDCQCEQPRIVWPKVEARCVALDEGLKMIRPRSKSSVHAGKWFNRFEGGLAVSMKTGVAFYTRHRLRGGFISTANTQVIFEWSDRKQSKFILARGQRLTIARIPERISVKRLDNRWVHSAVRDKRGKASYFPTLDNPLELQCDYYICVNVGRGNFISAKALHTGMLELDQRFEVPQQAADAFSQFLQMPFSFKNGLWVDKTGRVQSTVCKFSWGNFLKRCSLKKKDPPSLPPVVPNANVVPLFSGRIFPSSDYVVLDESRYKTIASRPYYVRYCTVSESCNSLLVSARIVDKASPYTLEVIKGKLREGTTRVGFRLHYKPFAGCREPIFGVHSVPLEFFANGQPSQIFRVEVICTALRSIVDKEMHPSRYHGHGRFSVISGDPPPQYVFPFIVLQISVEDTLHTFLRGSRLGTYVPPFVVDMYETMSADARESRVKRLSRKVCR